MIRRILRRLRAVVARRSIERDMQDEIAGHLARATARLVSRGLSEREARLEARREFGNVSLIHEESRDVRTSQWVESVLSDVRYGARALRRFPVFTIVAVSSLGVGLGANTAIFGITYAILFEPLPIRDPDRLVALQRVENGSPTSAFSRAELDALRAAGALAITGFSDAGQVPITIGTQRELASATFVDGHFFDLVGVSPTRGRLLSAGDDASATPVAVISDQLWERLFARDPNVLGRVVALEGVSFAIVGVTPARYAGLYFPGNFQIALPLGAAGLLPSHASDQRRARSLTLVARLAKGMGMETATTAADLIFQRCCARRQLTDDPAGGTTSHLGLVDASHGIPNKKGDVRAEHARLLTILVLGVAIVLIIVCANVGSLLLARGAARERELAIRQSMGASRSRLVRQLLTESLQLAAIGALLGLVLAAWGTNVLARNLPRELAFASDRIQFAPKPAILIFTAAATCASLLLFGILPALRAVRVDLTEALKVRSKARDGARASIVDRGIVIAQVALALLLVSSAGLLVATLRNLRSVDTGFDAKGVLLAEVDAEVPPEEQPALMPRLSAMLEQAAAMPGVQHVALAWATPIVGGRFVRTDVAMPGAEPIGTEDVLAWTDAVTADYFAAMGIARLRGRVFTTADDSASERVAVVNAAFVRRYFSGKDPIDAIVRVTYPFAARQHVAGFAEANNIRIVGVVADARYQDLRVPDGSMMYVPVRQRGGWPGRFVIVARSAGDPTTLSAPLRSLINSVSPSVRAWRLSAMTDAVDRSLARERLLASLATLFGFVALSLAAIGLYGVIAFSVSQRTKEIGIRIALGAARSSLFWLVARSAMAIVGIGAAIGAPLAFSAGRALSAQLYGVGAHDPTVMSVALGALVIAAALATALPVLRVLRTDPLIALRSE